MVVLSDYKHSPIAWAGACAAPRGGRFVTYCPYLSHINHVFALWKLLPTLLQFSSVTSHHRSKHLQVDTIMATELMATEFDIWNLDRKATKYTVTKRIAEVLHQCPGPFVTDEDQRLPNFDVKLGEGVVGGSRNNGTGTLTMTKEVGRKFHRLYRQGEIVITVEGRALKFRHGDKPIRRDLTLTLQKAPFIDPDIEKERQEKLNALQRSFVVAKVQIGYSPSVVQFSSGLTPKNLRYLLSPSQCISALILSGMGARPDAT